MLQTTSNVEHGFSVMNLTCTPLRTSLSEPNLDRFMHICINGPEIFSKSDVEKIDDNFKKTNDSRRLDLQNMLLLISPKCVDSFCKQYV